MARGRLQGIKPLEPFVFRTLNISIVLSGVLKPAPKLDEIRRILRAQARYSESREVLPSELEALDRVLPDGGFPKGALSVLTGRAGAGLMSVAARVLARETKRGRAVAWVDADATVYPPALLALGIQLERLLMVRCPKDRGPFAAEQLIGSGAFGVVVASGLDRALTDVRARRLQMATECARVATLLVLEPSLARDLTQAALRLHITRRGNVTKFEVEKARVFNSSPSGHEDLV